MIIGKLKSGISGGLITNQCESTTLIVCKNIIEKLVTIALLLKELNIIKGGQNVTL